MKGNISKTRIISGIYSMLSRLGVDSFFMKEKQYKVVEEVAEKLHDAFSSVPDENEKGNKP